MTWQPLPPRSARRPSFNKLADAPAHAPTKLLRNRARRSAFTIARFAERHQNLFFMPATWKPLTGICWAAAILICRHLIPRSINSSHSELTRSAGDCRRTLPKDWPNSSKVADYNPEASSALSMSFVCRRRSDHRVSENSAETATTRLEVAIEHRLMHAETLAYLLHQIPLDRKFRQTDQPIPSAPQPDAQMSRVPAGTATLGLQRTENEQTNSGARSKSSWLGQ